MHLTTPATASLLLRFGAALGFSLFGYGKLVDSVSWIGFIPPWVTPFLPMTAGQFLTAVGVGEIILAAFLAFGLWTRTAAALAAFHLLGVLVVLGYTDLAVRDFVSFTAALALATLGSVTCHWRIDGRRTHSSFDIQNSSL